MKVYFTIEGGDGNPETQLYSNRVDMLDDAEEFLNLCLKAMGFNYARLTMEFINEVEEPSIDAIHCEGCSCKQEQSE